MARFVISGLWNNKAVKAASKALKSLEKDTKGWSLAAKSAWGAATAAALYYSKVLATKSVQAALADEKSQRQLAFTLTQVAGANNVSVIAAEANIEAMSRMYGIADDQLRPALASLVRATGSASIAFNGLELALSLSTATGANLQTVTNALNRAYNGTYTSLKKLVPTIDAVKIKNKDTIGIIKDLRKTYGEFAKNELNTTTNQFNKLKVAAGEAAEIIGGSIIDALGKLSSQAGGVNSIADKMEKIAYWASDFVTSITIAFEKLQADPILGPTFRFFQRIAKEAGNIANWVTAEGKQRRINLALVKSQTQQVISARNAEMTALKEKAKLENPNDKTLLQLIAEKMAREAGFKVTEDLDSLQTIAAAKRLEESRQYKASVLDAAQAQFDAIKNNYDLQNAVFKTQLTAFEAMYAAMKLTASQGIVIPVSMSASISSGDGAPRIITGLDKAPARGVSGMTLAKEAAIAARLAREAAGTFNPSDALDYSMNSQSYNPTSVGSGTTNYNVTVNASAVGSEQYLADVIAQSLAQAARLGLSSTPSGYIGSP